MRVVAAVHALRLRGAEKCTFDFATDGDSADSENKARMELLKPTETRVRFSLMWGSVERAQWPTACDYQHIGVSTQRKVMFLVANTAKWLPIFDAHDAPCNQPMVQHRTAQRFLRRAEPMRMALPCYLPPYQT